MGDWGGDEHSPYNTPSELGTSIGMSSIAQANNSRFALALGDNFYHSGVTSVHDPRFQETFENIFTGDSLSAKNGFMFHVVAGNHDHIGDVNAQIEYSNVSARWSFPNLYYTFTEVAEDGATVQFVMIDTVVIAGNSQIEGRSKQLNGSHLPGPLDAALASQQLQWLSDTLQASTADYLVVAGHYPVYSVCEHGPTQQLQDQVKPLLEKYKVTAYLAGHDHCSEHIDVGDGVQYHGIGSAAYHDGSFEHLHTVTSSQLKYREGVPGGGFASVLVTKDQLQLTHHDDKGAQLYVNSMYPRRQTKETVV